MPVRSLKLRLVVPRVDDRLEAARALWTTHAAINAAVAHYEVALLRLRGEAYQTTDCTVAREEVRSALLTDARAAQRRNVGRDQPGDDEEVLGLARRLYEAIVPAAIGQDGTAQAANAFLSPLTDSKSHGFLDAQGKLQRPQPNWVAGGAANDPEALEAAQAWLASDGAKPWLTDTGSPARWVRMARLGDPGWPKAFVEKRLALLQEASTGTSALIRRLMEIGLLPLIEPYIAPRLDSGREDRVSRWDRLAFRLAVGHLLSWESWCRRAAVDHQQRVARVAAFRRDHVQGAVVEKVERLRRYEAERKAELARIAAGLPITDGDFLISLRMTRGWDELREKWLRATDRCTEALFALVAEQQTRRRGRFGDPHLFRWLARPENHAIWADDGAANDAVAAVARLNTMQRLVDRSRDTATMSLPDPVEHPRSAEWEAEGGTNLKTWRMMKTADDRLHAILPLLRVNGAGADCYAETTITLPLAPSGQLREVALSADRKQLRVSYHNDAGERFEGRLGSADLLLDRDHLRHRDRQRLATGDIGAAYLKLAVDLEPQLPAVVDERLVLSAFHFQAAKGQKSKVGADVRPGLRVLSIDLGVRAFAACSVYELQTELRAGGSGFHLADLGFWAVHERSFLLEMPGERAGTTEARWRREADAELRRLRRAVSRHRRLLWATTAVDQAERRAHLDAYRKALAADDGGVASGWPFEEMIVAEIEAALDLAPPLWEHRLKALARRFRAEFGAVVAGWRRRTRARADGDDKRRKRSGKSVWALEHLMAARRFLQSWTLASRASGEIRRLDRDAMGVFAKGLLDHIGGLKDDHLKTGADLILQAMRGRLPVPNGKGWVEKFKPCHVLLFEDLSRYRMRTDRPRRENSLLMKWAHRSVPDEVAMQGALYGLHDARQTGRRSGALAGLCLDTGAAFSSRYRAATMTPGLRCHPVRARDLIDPFFRDLIERENPGFDLDRCRPGDLVPLTGGDIFVALTEAGRLAQAHADLNAARNLQRRFWTRHAEAFRVPAFKVEVDGATRWVPVSLGKRLQGALGGHGHLVPTGHDSGSCRWQPTSAAAWRRLAGASPDASDDDEDGAGRGDGADAAELAGLLQEALECSGERMVFFRDPSGIVLPADLYYPAVAFWSIVKAKTIAGLCNGG
jgi:hypothetical protein